MGSDKVPVLNPLPATLTCVTDKEPVPLLLNWIVCVAGDPTATSPKLAEEGVIVKPGCTPFPETEITAVAP
jgi:hypothetical protein